MSILLNGRDLALSLRRELKQKITELNFKPQLGVILIGNDPASHLYVSLKEQAAAETGIEIKKILLPPTCPIKEIIEQVQNFNKNPKIHGILVQLPLPKNINENSIINAIDPAKDADGFHPQNLTRFLNDQPAITPGVSAGIIKLIDLAGKNLSGKKAVLLVNSYEFAAPLKKLLTDKKVVVSINHQINPPQLQLADIIVVALGKPNIITGNLIKDGAIIIDVGITKVANKVKGDVKADDFNNRHVYLTPVPGGVGPMTVAMLLWNVYWLARTHSLKNGIL